MMGIAFSEDLDKWEIQYANTFDFNFGLCFTRVSFG